MPKVSGILKSVVGNIKVGLQKSTKQPPVETPREEQQDLLPHLPRDLWIARFDLQLGCGCCWDGCWDCKMERESWKGIPYAVSFTCLYLQDDDIDLGLDQRSDSMVGILKQGKGGSWTVRSGEDGRRSAEGSGGGGA